MITTGEMQPNITNSYCFRTDDRQGSRVPGLPAEKDEEQEGIDPAQAIFCRACGKAVTSRDRKIAVRGSHAHTFFNPAGIVFELGCFSTAPGCYQAGAASSEFTWFAGHFWRYALCRGCNSHLGWAFSSGGKAFWGLILANLTE